MTDFIEESTFEIGRRVEIRESYAWLVVLKPAIDSEEAFEDFAAGLSAVLNQRPRIVHGTATSMQDLRTDLNEPGTDAVLIQDLDQADPDHWRALDVNRSGLVRKGPVVLWLSSVGLTRLCQYAPNLRSFVGGSIFHLGTHGEAMTADDRHQRISELEAHFQMTSADVIFRAESGSLPTEPHFVEWLVLLHRGDLI